MTNKEEALDQIVNEYTCEADCIFSKLRDLLSGDRFNSDDMRALRDCA